jgi:DNA-binding SARP family transcriptional activator
VPLDLLLLGAGVWIALTLVLPKRRLAGLRRRLAETGAGERPYVFGPPRHPASEPSSLPGRLVATARSEWLRALELGIPVFALALVVETWGRQARSVAEERWTHSPAGLLLRHLQGEVTEANLTQSLEAWGQPIPPPKLTLEAPRRYRVPPVEWRRDWEDRAAVVSPQLEGSSPPVNGVGGEALEPVATPGEVGLEIQTLGGLRVIAAGADLTSELLEHPILSFIIAYVLVRAIIAPGKPTTRSVIADELFPGVDPQVQRERLRHRLHDLSSLLPEPLAAAVIVQGETLWFNSEACSVDVLRILELADECVRADGHLPSEVYAAARDALAAGDAEFFPQFGEIERRATGGGGEAAELAREVQRRLEVARIDLLAGLAQHHLVRRQPDQAAAFLEEALRRNPGRDDLRRRLESAHLESGRADRGAAPDSS